MTGKGAAVKAGDTVSVDYVGVLFSNGKEFDSSFGKKPFTFKVGEGSVIQGWDQGLTGMKVGQARAGDPRRSRLRQCRSAAHHSGECVARLRRRPQEDLLKPRRRTW